MVIPISRPKFETIMHIIDHGSSIFRVTVLLTYIGMPRIPVYLEKLSRPA